MLKALDDPTQHTEDWDDSKSITSEQSVECKFYQDFRSDYKKEFNKLREEIQLMLKAMNEDGSKNFMVETIMKNVKKFKKEIDYLMKICKEEEVKASKF